MDIDHYRVLGLPSGLEGAKLSEKDISKAYKFKALELHPDKRPDDPKAPAEFQKLLSSYEILKDEKARKLVDQLLRVKAEHEARRKQHGAKRQRMVSDLEAKERAAFAPDPLSEANEEEERVSRKLREEIERIRAEHSTKSKLRTSSSENESLSKRNGDGNNSFASLDKEKVLKVSWEQGVERYNARTLRELFEKFGGVEDVVIRSSKKKGSALVVMRSKDAVISAMGCMCGDRSNPLLVQPLHISVEENFPSARKLEDHLVGVVHQSFEDSVLKKLQKAAEGQK